MIGPAIYNAVLGTKFKIVYGYQGGAYIDLAMKRGEVDGRGNNTWAGYKATMPNEVRDGMLNVLIQTGLQQDRDLPNVPLFLDLAKGDPEREPIAKFMSQAVAIARPVAAPPGVPDDRIELLRRAFDDTMMDPAFLAEAGKLNARNRSADRRAGAGHRHASARDAEANHQSDPVDARPTGELNGVPRHDCYHNRLVASPAPSDSDLSFAQATSGWTSSPAAEVANPQSLLAMTFSRPATLAKRWMRCATSSGCST